MQDAARALASYHRQPCGLRAVTDYLTGPNAPETANLRAAAARGLGISTEPARRPHVLATLDWTPGNPRPSAPPRRTRSSAMTGLRANGQDPGALAALVDANAIKPPDQFKADLLDRLRRPCPSRPTSCRSWKPLRHRPARGQCRFPRAEPRGPGPGDPRGGGAAGRAGVRHHRPARRRRQGRGSAP